MPTPTRSPRRLRASAEHVAHRAPTTLRAAPPRDRPDTVKGTSGIKRSHGRIHEEYLTRLQGTRAIDVFDHMRRSDAMVRTLWLTTILPLLSAEWTVEVGGIDPETATKPEIAKAEKIRDFVKVALFERADRTFPEMLRESLLHLIYGFIVQYVALKAEDGQVWLKDLYLRHPRSILAATTPWEWDGDELRGLWQSDMYANAGRAEQVFIPRDEFLLVTNEQEGANIEGISNLRPLYRPWDAKSELTNILLIGLDQQAVGTIKATMQDRINADRQSALEEVIRNMRAGEEAGVVLSAGEELEIIPGQLNAVALMEAIKYCDSDMARAWMAAFTLLGQDGRGGAYALSADQTDLFMVSEEALGKRVAANYRKDVFKKLTILNFGNDAARYTPTLTCSIARENREQYVKMWQMLNAGTSPLVTMGENDEDAIRKMVKAPPRELPRPERPAPPDPNAAPPGIAPPTNAGGQQKPATPPPSTRPAPPKRPATAVSEFYGDGFPDDPPFPSEGAAGTDPFAPSGLGRGFFNPHHDSKGRFAPRSGSPVASAPPRRAPVARPSFTKESPAYKAHMATTHEAGVAAKKAHVEASRAGTPEAHATAAEKCRAAIAHHEANSKLTTREDLLDFHRDRIETYRDFQREHEAAASGVTPAKGRSAGSSPKPVEHLEHLYADPDAQTPGERSKAKKALKEAHATDPQARDVMDTVSIFTQGSFDDVQSVALAQADGTWPKKVAEERQARLDARQRGDVRYGGSDAITVASHPMATVKDIQGREIYALTADEAARAVPDLMDHIAAAPVYEKPVYRGVHHNFDTGERPRYGVNEAEWATIPKYHSFAVGETLELAAPTSFTRSSDVALDFAAQQARGMAKNRNPNGARYQTVVEVRGGAKGIHVDHLSPWKGQKEFLTQGQFRVVEVSEEEFVWERGTYGARNDIGKRQRVVVEHEGVYEGTRHQLPAAPPELKPPPRLRGTP